MNKKQKILAILGLGLVLFLFLTNTPVRAQTSPAASNTDAPAQTQTPPATTPDTKKNIPAPAVAGGGTETIIGGIGVAVISKIFEIVNYIIGFIGGILFSLAGGLTRFTLGLNFDILNNSLVTVGWQISRDLANLGFVLFIIIIAIATILRFQQYGAKNTLGKLIAVALLVNFSLVFAGIFIDFSNMLTNFFITRTTGSGIIGLDSALANAFKIQNLLRVEDVENIKTEVGEWGARGALGASFGGALIGIASMFFVAIFTLLGAFSLLALAIMFLIRVIALAILLVLVPLACLFVILPVTKNLWDQWWKNFMKWILFAPAASFFLYLSVAMAINYGKAIRGMAQSVQGIGTTDQITFGNLLIKEPLEQIGHMIIIIGFLLGGLIAANSFGIHGSKAFLGMAQATGKWARGTIGRKTWEGVGGITGREGVRKLTEKMATSRIAPARWLGRGINRLGAQAERIPAEQYQKQIKGMSPQRLNIEAQSSTGARRAVILNELAKKKNLSTETITRFFSDPKTMANIEKDFKTGGLNFKDIEKTIGRNLKMVSAKTNEEWISATDEFVKSLSPKDFAKGHWNEIFKETTNKQSQLLQKQLVGAFTQHDPGALNRIVKNLKGEVQDNFKSVVNLEIQFLKTHSDDKMKELGKQAERVLKGGLRKRLMGEEGFAEPPTAPPTA